MKPHRLAIEAFGPYAEPVEIGFDALSREGLFLIHGTTGAGKTFLLDALCFALYGEVSGERSLKGLRSDHAAAGAVPRVRLEFSAAGARYRVERSPAYTAQRSRGTGTVEKLAQAALFREQGGAWEPLVSRISEVGREVEGLVGLNAAQFRQVILLPQGRFAEVLRARADEREALLKTLFDTVIYERAAHWLDERAKAARLVVMQQRRDQELLCSQAARLWTLHAPADPGAEGAGEGAADGADPETTAALPADQAGLDQLAGAITALAEGSAERLRQCEATRTAALLLQQERQRLADRWDRRAAARQRLVQLLAEREPIDQLRQRLLAAEKAEALRPSLEAERTAREALQTLQSSIAQQLRSAGRARDGARALPAVVLALDLLALPGLERLAEASAALAARQAELQALVRRAREQAEAQARAREAAARVATADAQLLRGAAAREAKQQERLAAQEAFRRACTARDQLEGLERAARQAGEVAAAAAAIAPAQQRAAAAASARNRADQQLNNRTAELLELRSQQLSGMAARLASGLEEGAGCPVCGSTHHPAPARDAGDAVGEEAIAAAERRLEAASREARQGAENAAGAEAELRAAIARAGEAGLDPQAARAAATAAAQTHAQARALAERAAGLEQASAEREAELQRIEAAIQKITTQRALEERAATEEASRAQALAAEIRAALGEDLEPQGVLQAYGPLEQALKALAVSAEASARATTRQEQAARRLAEELGVAGFADAPALEAALQPQETRRDWTAQIERFQREITEQQGILAAADLHDLPELRPDTAAARAALGEADAARTAALERHSELRAASAEIARLAAEHHAGGEALLRGQEEAQRLSVLADRCQGRTAPYISLQRWVLSAYLGEICEHANRRLELMTSGRYQLRLSDEGGRGGRLAGLGLRVLDAYTGEEREVNSLSGGETFQASLALALGVADTVQSHAGGVRLEALFIDEGFGSLDPDNLQLAMDELDRLREGGRMIGIISHVGALRERIRAGIEVLASDRGSTVRVGSSGPL